MKIASKECFHKGTQLAYALLVLQERPSASEKDPHLVEASEKVRIYNCNLGLVWSIDAAEGLFAVLYPDASGDNRIVIYAFDDFKNIVDLGYALTILQGQPYVRCLQGLARHIEARKPFQDNIEVQKR